MRLADALRALAAAIDAEHSAHLDARLAGLVETVDAMADTQITIGGDTYEVEPETDTTLLLVLRDLMHAEATAAGQTAAGVLADYGLLDGLED